MTSGSAEEVERPPSEAEAPDRGQFAYEEAALGADGEADEPEAAGDEPDSEPSRTPMGNKRGGVTESDEIDYRLPSPKVLDRGKADPGPDTRDRETVSRALLEALRNFGIEAKLLGVVSGPHVSRYELQLAPGNEGLQGGSAPG